MYQYLVTMNFSTSVSINYDRFYVKGIYIVKGRNIFFVFVLN